VIRGYLLVRADGREYGLPVASVVEVGDLGEVLDVPRALPAVRGLTPLRGRLVPLIHLAALLAGRAPPPERGRSAVLVRLRGRYVAFEVDDADEVVREDALPVPRGHTLPWAAAVAQRPAGRRESGNNEGGGEHLVPILDLDALGDRIG
jgi:chemotaxis signal transduction protein